MTKAKRMMQEDIKLINLVIELLDARAPLSSRNPDIDELAEGKARLVLLNKTDLADERLTQRWFDYFIRQGLHVCKVNCKNSADMKQINAVVRKACADKIERDRKRGIRNRPVRAMVVGIPNVGKSTFINTYVRRAAAKTGNRPGVTKGKQWIRLGNSIELLDTPGILWPKFEDQSVGLKLAMIGSIRDEIMDTEKLALELIRLLNERYPDALNDYYKPENADISAFLEQSRTIGATPGEDVIMLAKISGVRGCLKAGGELDLLRGANLLLENFRNGRIGRFTLEEPEK